MNDTTGLRQGTGQCFLTKSLKTRQYSEHKQMCKHGLLISHSERSRGHSWRQTTFRLWLLFKSSHRSLWPSYTGAHQWHSRLYFSLFKIKGALWCKSEFIFYKIDFLFSFNCDMNITLWIVFFPPYWIGSLLSGSYWFQKPRKLVQLDMFYLTLKTHKLNTPF